MYDDGFEHPEPNPKKLSNCPACGSVIANEYLLCPRCGHFSTFYKLPLAILCLWTWISVLAIIATLIVALLGGL